jgi:hypothetical protein
MARVGGQRPRLCLTRQGAGASAPPRADRVPLRTSRVLAPLDQTRERAAIIPRTATPGTVHVGASAPPVRPASLLQNPRASASGGARLVVVPPGTSPAGCGRESTAGLLPVDKGPRSEGHPAPHLQGSGVASAAATGLGVCYRPFLYCGREVAKGRPPGRA